MKRKPRVLIDSFHLFQALTGIRTYTTQLCEGLEKSGNDELEYLIYPNWKWVNKTSFLRGKVSVPKKILNHLLFFVWKQCCLPLIILFKRVDLVVATDYLLPYFKFGAKSLAVVHDTFYWELKGNYNPVWRWYFLKSVKNGLNRRSGIIVTTEFIREKAKALVTDKYPFTVVYQAPKGLQYPGENSFDLQQLGLPKKASYFLHVGIFETRKNLRLLVKAFARLRMDEFYKDYYLVLAGGRGVGLFHDDYQGLKRLIRELGLEDRVIMPGFVPNELLGGLYMSAFAYVFPSKEEGFGIPVIEAMKSGIPVIISDQPALMEVAGEAALVFDMNDEETLYKQMLRLKDQRLRQQLISEGKVRAEKFSQKAFVKQFHQAILERLRN